MLEIVYVFEAVRLQSGPPPLCIFDQGKDGSTPTALSGALLSVARQLSPVWQRVFKHCEQLESTLLERESTGGQEAVRRFAAGLSTQERANHVSMSRIMDALIKLKLQLDRLCSSPQAVDKAAPLAQVKTQAWLREQPPPAVSAGATLVRSLSLAQAYDEDADHDVWNASKRDELLSSAGLPPSGKKQAGSGRAEEASGGERRAQAARHGLLRFPVLQALCRWKASFSFFAELSGEDRDTVFCLLQPFSKKLKIIRREMDRRVRALPAASQLTMKIRRDGPQSSWPGGWAVHVCTLCGP